MEKALGYFENPVDTRKKFQRTRETPVGNFVADSLRWRFGTDIALVNGGTLRGERIFPAGAISEKLLTELLPFRNTIDIVTLTGVQLRRIMELSASALVTEDEEHDPAFRVPDGGFLQVSGLKVVYDPKEKPTLFDAGGRVDSWGGRLKRLSVLKDGEGREVEDSGTYTAAVCDWLSKGGDRYFVFSEVQPTHTDTLDIDVLVEYIRSFPDGKVRMKTEGRIAFEGQ